MQKQITFEFREDSEVKPVVEIQVTSQKDGKRYRSAFYYKQEYNQVLSDFCKAVQRTINISEVQHQMTDDQLAASLRKVKNNPKATSSMIKKAQKAINNHEEK